MVARRRPTLPRLKTQYHGRRCVSRPCSGWERVLQHRDSHRATVQDHKDDLMICCVYVLLRDLALCAVNLFLSSLRWLLDMEFYRVISTA
jgi:hypothetical protein